MPSASRPQASGRARRSRPASSHQHTVPAMPNSYLSQAPSTPANMHQPQGYTLIEGGLPQQRMPEPGSMACNTGGPGAQYLPDMALSLEYLANYPQHVDVPFITADGRTVPAAGQAVNVPQASGHQHPMEPSLAARRLTPHTLAEVQAFHIGTDRRRSQPHVGRRSGASN